MEDSDDISNRSMRMSFVRKDSELNNKENIIYYFISSFHNWIWDDKTCFFNCQKPQIENISLEFKDISDKNKDYTYRIFCINLKKKEKYVYLLCNYEHLKNLELKEFYLKYTIRFIFEDVNFKDKSLTRLIEEIENKYGNNKLSRDNYFLKLDAEQKLAIYKNFIEKTYNKKNIFDKYSEKLAGDFLYFLESLKKSGLKELNFSTAVNLFILSHNNKYILIFLEKWNNYIYNKDSINKEYFSNILNDYINDKTQLSAIFFTNKRKLKIEDYEKSLNNFLLTYYSLYQKDKLDDINIALKSKEILFNLINNRKDIIETTKMVYDYIDILFSLYQNNLNNSRIKIENIKKITNCNFDDLKNYYPKIVNYQRTNRKEYFIDFSKIIQEFQKIYSNNLLYLEKILELFTYELNQESNYALRYNLTINYYNVGMNCYQNGNLKNEKLLNFIKTCDVYKSTKIDTVISNNKFIKTYNLLLQNKKNIDILNGLDILSKDGPKIISQINNLKIYMHFSYDMPKEYISIFTNKISHIKNLGLFFIILPKDSFLPESINILYNWVVQNLLTFSKRECKNIKKDLNDFLEVLIKINQNLAIDFIQILKQKINIFCRELFLYFLNNNKTLNERIIRELILYFISQKSFEFGNYNITNIDNIKYFVKNFEKDDDKIIKIFYDEMRNLSIDENDLLDVYPTNKYKIFNLLLEYKQKFIKNKKGEYLDKTKKFFVDILQKFKTFKYDFIKIKLLFISNIEKDDFKMKIEKILKFLSDDEENDKNIKEESIQIFQKLLDKYEKVEQIKNDLGEASYYLETFFDKIEDKIKIKNQINNLINEILRKTLAQILDDENIKNEIKKYNDLIKESKPIMEKKKFSALFNAIYKSNKQKIEDQNYLLKETKNNYISAIKLITENPNKIQNNKYINFYYEIGYQNEENLEKEINWIIQNEKIKINDENKNKLFSSLKLLIKKQNITNVISGILIMIAIYEKNLLPSTEEEKYFNELKEKYKLLSQNISSKDIQSIINFINQKFKEITFDTKDKKKKNYILLFFNSFNTNKDAFIYFKDIKNEDISHLKEFLLDSDERELTLQQIDEFIQIIKFLNDNITNIKNPFILIQTFISGILDKKKFMNYLTIIKYYNKFKNLIDKFLKGETGIFNKVKDIMNESTFSIVLSKDNIYELNGKYMKNTILIKNEKPKLMEIKSDEINDLYEKVFISVRQDNKQDYINDFIQNYKYMKTVNDLINEMLIKYGFPEEIIIIFNIKIELKCFFNSKEYKILELINYFKQEEIKCEKILSKAIANSNEIRFFYGKQLYLINKCIMRKEIDEIKDLITCVTNGIIIDFNSDFKYVEEKGKNIYENMINNIKNFINTQLIYNGKKIEDIYSKNIIQNIENNKKEKIDYKGFYFYPTSIEENDILNIFYFLTKSIPMNNNILFCNRETSIEEIHTFILKSIYCENNSLFLIFIPQYINNLQKMYLVKLLREKENDSQMMKSCLVILFNFSDSEFHQSIMKNGNINLLNIPYIMDLDFQLDKEINAQIISSTICGLGKSKLIGQGKEKIIYLPIGGEMTKEELKHRIIKSFKKVKIEKNKNYILHIDFTQTDNTEIVKDFLFKLLILKKFEIEENVIYLNQNIKIYIEIPNDFFDYINKYKILSNFQRSLKIKEIGEFKFDQNEDKENIKKVSVILTSFKNNTILKKIPDFNKDFINDDNHTKNIILEYLEIKNPNYYQIKSFIRILAFEFEKFNQCFGFDPVLLKENLQLLKMSEEEALNVRKIVVQNLIKITKHFTSGPFEELIKIQGDTKLKLEDKNMDKDLIEIMESKIKGITYNDIKPSLVVFNLDGGSISILTTLSEKDQEFKSLETLFNSQNYANFIKGKKAPKLKNLSSLSNEDILTILKNFLNINLSEKEIRNIVGNYVYTADNLIKVILIILRIEAKVPVIMMGETGCGKTRLIEMAFKLKNKNKDISIKKLDIHAGTNDNDIIEFIEKTIKEVEDEDKKLILEKMSEKDNNNNIEEIQKEINNREIWIFFDEINTCNSMGLLTEILCKNSYQGTPINERFVFIAACNPYRLLTSKRKMDEILLHKKVNKNMLVYSVNPLPHSLLNFVLYFGRLKAEDEKEYIKSMVISTMESYKENYKKNMKDYNNLINIQIECISIAHNFLKKENDISIVSLREVNRFLELFKFFENFIEKRNKNDPYFDSHEYIILNQDDIIYYYKNKNKYFYHRAAVNLSLFLCYYLRLPDKKSRKELEGLIDEKKYFVDKFIKIPELEMDYIINNFNIPTGIAKNKALKENLFSTFVCIVNKIPIIICGKPGRSKTLCIEILQNSMKGKLSSKTYLCKTFPELIIYKIQGALNTKTDDVIKVFKEAREKQKEDQGKSEQLHLVLMDEMGLAELSLNNPLKVTHFELEREDEEKVPFVGISNWALDASKMNRVIYIVVQDPDKDDLQLTAKEIVKSYDNNSEIYYDKYSKYFKKLSVAYFNFIDNKIQKNDENKYFHGSRDFYSLIKNVISDIIKNKNELEKIPKEKRK